MPSPTSQQNYFSLGLDRLTPEEKLDLGSLLVESALPDLKRLPTPVADKVWENIYQAEAIIKISANAIDTQLCGELESRICGSLESAVALLNETLTLVDNHRFDA